MKDKSFLDIHKENMDVLGFWSEQYKSVFVSAIERIYRKSIIKEWYISDVVLNDKKVLVKWNKRLEPLSDIEIEEIYGINGHHA